MSGISPKRQRFIDEYLKDLNATQAAKRAGYSPKTAKQQGSQLLSYLDSEIKEAIAKRRERTEFDQDKVLRELAKLAFTNMADFARWNKSGVTLIDSEDLSRDDTAAVTEVTFTPGEFGDVVKIKLGHKDSSLRMLAQHLGLLDSPETDVGKMADSFMAGVHTVREMAVKDMSE